MQKIDSLQGLRAVAFLGIFISHCNLGKIEALGAWGVSVFLTLSGFLMLYNYYPKTQVYKFGIRFPAKKIKKIYPLHLATMLGGLIYSIVIIRRPFKYLIIDLLLHSTLTQIWIPYSKWYSTLNSISWYLCVCCFTYFVFPLLLSFMKKHNKKSVIRMMLVSFSLQILISLIAYFIGNPDRNAFLSVHWITYFCPLSRLLDFINGCCLGYFYLNKAEQNKTRARFILEPVVILCIIISFVLYTYEFTIFGKPYTKTALLFTLTSSLLIWICADSIRGGVLCHLLSLKPFVKLGNLSSYAFLIHLLAIKFCYLIINNIFPDLSRIFVAITAFFVTLAASEIWLYIERKFIFRKNKSLI